MWIYCGYIYITNIHQFTAGWLIQRSFLTTAPFGIWFGMMIRTDEHIFQGVKSPTTKPLVICLMGEFLSTGMVELGIVGVSAITMNHNESQWWVLDLLWFTMISPAKCWLKEAVFFTLPPPGGEKISAASHGIPGEDTWDFRLCPVDLPAIFTAPEPFRHCRLHGKIHGNPPFVDRWFSHWNINLCIEDFPLAFNERGGYVLFDGGSIYTWKSGTNTPALRNFDRKNSHYPVPLGAPIFSGNSILIVGSLYLMYLYNSWPFLSQSQHVARIEARDVRSKVLAASAGVHLFTTGSPIKSTYF